MKDEEESITQIRVRLYREALGLPPIDAEANRKGAKTEDGQPADANADIPSS